MKTVGVGFHRMRSRAVMDYQQNILDSMEYESGYSRTQMHFIVKAPDWLSLVDRSRELKSILDLPQC